MKIWVENHPGLAICVLILIANFALLLVFILINHLTEW